MSDTFDQMIQDMQAIARELGLHDGAQPISPHQVVQEQIIPAIRALRAGTITDDVVRNVAVAHSLIDTAFRRVRAQDNSRGIERVHQLCDSHSVPTYFDFVEPVRIWRRVEWLIGERNRLLNQDSPAIPPRDPGCP